jgi:hypothetical protein
MSAANSKYLIFLGCAILRVSSYENSSESFLLNLGLCWLRCLNSTVAAPTYPVSHEAMLVWMQ